MIIRNSTRIPVIKNTSVNFRLCLDGRGTLFPPTSVIDPFSAISDAVPAVKENGICRNTSGEMCDLSGIDS